MRWDLFCRVVDHYGDAGVCWRLARLLTAEHGIAVRLWIDAPATLARLASQVDPTLDAQLVAGVEVRRWALPDQRGPADPLPDTAGGAAGPRAVIEAFGCGLPEAYLDAMEKLPFDPVWINLEYLTAEAWVEGCHGLPSRHPSRPLTRYFFFPGFTTRTGGLLRERAPDDARQRLGGDLASSNAFDEPRGGPDANALRISVFAYEGTALAGLFGAWSRWRRPIRATIPEGVLVPELREWSGARLNAPGDRVTCGVLDVAVVPFVNQDAFDRVLWSSDLNFVRGEDSFVRAQWAGRPFVWQPYRQEDDAHRIKLDAFLARYAAPLPPAARTALVSLAHAWNGEGVGGQQWDDFASSMPVLATHANRWTDTLREAPELAAALFRFVESRL